MINHSHENNRSRIWRFRFRTWGFVVSCGLRLCAQFRGGPCGRRVRVFTQLVPGLCLNRLAKAEDHLSWGSGTVLRNVLMR